MLIYNLYNIDISCRLLLVKMYLKKPTDRFKYKAVSGFEFSVCLQITI